MNILDLKHLLSALCTIILAISSSLYKKLVYSQLALLQFLQIYAISITVT